MIVLASMDDIPSLILFHTSFVSFQQGFQLTWGRVHAKACIMRWFNPRGVYSYTWAWVEGSVVMTPILGIFDPIGSIFYA